MWELLPKVRLGEHFNHGEDFACSIMQVIWYKVGHCIYSEELITYAPHADCSNVASGMGEGISAPKYRYILNG
jgi:hypothetical protein